MASPPFAVFFVGKTTPLVPGAGIVQTDPTHWILDIMALAGGAGTAYQEIKEVALFLTQPNVLPPDAALALYVSTTGGTAWSFRGMVSNAHPSDVLPLSFPEPEAGAPLVPQIGISLEPLAEASAREGMKLAAKEEFAKRVGQDLYNFMASFGGVQQVGQGQLLVPSNVLDAWFNRISTRLRRDPDFLTRSQLTV